MSAAQGTEEWFKDRLGYCSASRFSDAMAAGKALTKRKYMYELSYERLQEKMLPQFSNANIIRGNELEPHARIAYEIATKRIVEEVGFVKHKKLMAGSSPDGLVGADGGIEIKCVLETTQIATIVGGEYPKAHTAQIQGNLWITDRKWWDFISYCPELGEKLELYIFRVQRDDKFIKEMEAKIIEFLKEVDGYQTQLKNFKLKAA